MTDCQICIEPFNKSNRLPISCVYCAQKFCRTCVGQYLLSQQEQITCPNTDCRMPWTEEFIDEHMYAIFRKGALATHRQKFVLDREKARLPELQARARRYKTALDVMNGRLKQKSEFMEQYNLVPVVIALNQLNSVFMRKHKNYYDVAANKWKIYNYNNNRTQLMFTVREGVLQADADAFEANMIATRKERIDAENAVNNYKLTNKTALDEAKRIYSTPAKAVAKMPAHRQMVDTYGSVVRLYESDKRRITEYQQLFGADAVEIVQQGERTNIVARQVVVLRGCPGEGCRGFLNEQYVCGVCSLSVCRQCHIGLAENELVLGDTAPSDTAPEGKQWHICDPDQIATARMIARDTKPCPKCKALISKIDGCDQMWCTQCQTPFSWITGQVEDGRVHNPHYYEWMRRTQGSVPRVPQAPNGDDCCAQALVLQDLPFETIEHVAETTLFDNIFVDMLEGIPSTWMLGTLPPSKELIVATTKKIKSLSAEFLINIHRKLVEIYEYNVRDRPNWNEQYADRKGDEDAIDYLVGQLSEAEWQRRVWSRDRARRYRNDCKEIKRMFYAAGRDIMNSLTQGGGSMKVGETLKQIENLRVYANDSMLKSKKRYCLYSDPDSISIYRYVNYTGVDEISSLYKLFNKEYIANPPHLAYYFNLKSMLDLVGV